MYSYPLDVGMSRGHTLKLNCVQMRVFESTVACLAVQQIVVLGQGGVSGECLFITMILNVMLCLRQGRFYFFLWLFLFIFAVLRVLSGLEHSGDISQSTVI